LHAEPPKRPLTAGVRSAEEASHFAGTVVKELFVRAHSRRERIAALHEGAESYRRRAFGVHRGLGSVASSVSIWFSFASVSCGR